MYIYSSHGRCTSPHVRPLSRKHGRAHTPSGGPSRRGGAPRGCVGNPFPLRAGPHVPTPTCPEQCGAAPRGCVGHPFPLRAGPHVPIPTCPCVRGYACVGMRVRARGRVENDVHRARRWSARSAQCCVYSEYSRRHTCPYRPPPHLWAKCGSAWVRARACAHLCACVRRSAWVCERLCACVRVLSVCVCACARACACVHSGEYACSHCRRTARPQHPGLHVAPVTARCNR
jgi:hypothetical protein